jgi:S-adenosylmethionine:tRNA ribosyltransferase-isomerase
MRLSDFDYHLPPELIAQEPAARREDGRLMTVDRAGNGIAETTVAALPSLLQPGDLLVVNDTRVIPARLLGKKETGGKAEIFLVRRVPGEGECWQALMKASKAPRPGSSISLPDGVTARIEERLDGQKWLLSFSPEQGFHDWLESHGAMPLPPYIRRQAGSGDRERYQTVFARERGAVAAPTAGLHFTEPLMDAIRQRGVEIVPLTLHVGLGTFMPVRVEELAEHRMHKEVYRISQETAQAIGRCRARGGRVVAVGTTVARTLEQAGEADGTVVAGEGEADIFIRPGYCFRVVDALVTNFHLPKSTLLMLVSAFAGRELVLRAYEEAVARRFRFFSYGDAMFIY